MGSKVAAATPDERIFIIGAPDCGSQRKKGNQNLKSQNPNPKKIPNPNPKEASWDSWILDFEIFLGFGISIPKKSQNPKSKNPSSPPWDLGLGFFWDLDFGI